MITDKSRDYYIGASDTQYVMSNFNSKTFKRWWLIKIGAEGNDYENIYTNAGNRYEQKILDTLFVPYRNEQVIIGQLRVNIDGRTDEEICEVKTHKNKFRVTKAYWYQCQVEMWAFQVYHSRIIAYQMQPDDYEFNNEIDLERITQHPIEYDETFIYEQYLPRFHYLCWCFKYDIQPSDGGFEEWKGVTNGEIS